MLGMEGKRMLHRNRTTSPSKKKNMREKKGINASRQWCEVRVMGIVPYDIDGMSFCHSRRFNEPSLNSFGPATAFLEAFAQESQLQILNSNLLLFFHYVSFSSLRLLYHHHHHLVCALAHPFSRSSSIENDTKWKICLEHFGRRTHHVLIIVNSPVLLASVAAIAVVVINKADWWHSNMVKGSIVYWFKSRFLHITFLFFFPSNFSE